MTTCSSPTAYGVLPETAPGKAGFVVLHGKAQDAKVWTATLGVSKFEVLQTRWDEAAARRYLQLVCSSAWTLPCGVGLLEYALNALERTVYPEDLMVVVRGVQADPRLLRGMASESGECLEHLRLQVTPAWIAPNWAGESA